MNDASVLLLVFFEVTQDGYPLPILRCVDEATNDTFVALKCVADQLKPPWALTNLQVRQSGELYQLILGYPCIKWTVLLKHTSGLHFIFVLPSWSLTSTSGTLYQEPATSKGLRLIFTYK